MAKKKAKITLVGPLSYAVGRYRFMKGRMVVSDDSELIRYCEMNPDFKVQEMEVEEETSSPPKPETKAAKQTATKSAQESVGGTSKKLKPKPEPIEDDELEDEPDSKAEAESESVPSPRLARKKRTEMAHETN